MKSQHHVSAHRWSSPKGSDWMRGLAHMEVLLPLADAKSVTSVFCWWFNRLFLLNDTPLPPLQWFMAL